MADSPWLWLGLGVCFVLIIVALIYVFSPKVPVEVLNVSNSSANVSFDFYIESNAISIVQYSLSNGSQVLLSGQLFPNVVEEHGDVLNGTQVNLSVYSDMYYWNFSSCNISFNHSHCKVFVSLKASDYYLSLFNNSLQFTLPTANSVVQSPVACFFWNSPLWDVVLPYPRASIPSALKYNVSICYNLSDISSSLTIPMDLRWNRVLNGSVNLSVFVIDKEIIPYKNIGIRYADIIVEKNGN